MLGSVLSGTMKSPLSPAEKHRFHRPIFPEAPHTVVQGEMSFGSLLEKGLTSALTEVTSLATQVILTFISSSLLVK